MKIKNEFIMKNIADEYVCVSANEESNNSEIIITLNDTGAFIWNIMQNDVSFEYIINKMLEVYNVDKTTAEDDLKEFIDIVKKADIVEE